MKVEIRSLSRISSSDFHRIVSGYISDSKYEVSWQDSGDSVSINFSLATLKSPYTKVYKPVDEDTIDQYNEILKIGFSFGVYKGESLAGILIAEPEHWNISIWVREFHVVKEYQGIGLGRQLMATLVDLASQQGFRTIICETQNKNVPAIRFYRKLGFRVEGVDISYYSNEDYPDGDVAIFMKRRL